MEKRKPIDLEAERLVDRIAESISDLDFESALFYTKKLKELKEHNQ